MESLTWAPWSFGSVKSGACFHALDHFRSAETHGTMVKAPSATAMVNFICPPPTANTVTGGFIPPRGRQRSRPLRKKTVAPCRASGVNRPCGCRAWEPSVDHRSSQRASRPPSREALPERQQGERSMPALRVVREATGAAAARPIHTGVTAATCRRAGGRPCYRCRVATTSLAGERSPLQAIRRGAVRKRRVYPSRSY